MTIHRTDDWHVVLSSSLPRHELIDTVGDIFGRSLWLIVAALVGALVVQHSHTTDNPEIGGQVIGEMFCQEDEAIALSPAGPVCVYIEGITS